MKKYLKIALTLFIVLIIVLGFALPLNPVGNWYQQFMPNIGGRTIQDITFLDSLTGYASARQSGDTSYILKTTNGGDSWQIIYRNFFAMTQIQFLNVNTGYACGAYLFKTTDGGFDWNQVTAPAISPEELFVLSEDTIWIISSNSLVGGVFRTTNGGVNWQPQLNLGSQNPVKIYMYNARIGFIAKNTGSSYTRRTTDGGFNWSTPVINKGFSDIFFTDSLKGWSAFDSVRTTTDGGLNWQTQVLPYGSYNGGLLNYSFIFKFSAINKDTIWGAGGRIAYPNTQLRGLIYRTTNGGANWQFQLPDTGINIAQYLYVQFINKNTGWAYSQNGIHTTTGGDPIWLTGITQISNNIPKDYKLYQNYPNPFNPRTNIKYELKSRKFVKLKVFEVTGKEISVLVNHVQTAGTYQVDFPGNGLSSGVYFYSLIIDGTIIETKKMLMIK